MKQQGEQRIIQKIECFLVWSKDSYFACLQPTFGLQSVLVRQEEVLFVLPARPTRIFNLAYLLQHLLPAENDHFFLLLTISLKRSLFSYN